jgi:biotin carboxyl carrier protein
MATRPLILRYGTTDHRATVVDDGTVTIDGSAPIAAVRGSDGAIRVGDDPRRVAWAAAAGDTRWVFLDGEVYRFDVVREAKGARSSGHHGSLAAPMPATVIRIQTAAGASVQRGQPIVVLEAMKMELPVLAPADGTVISVRCREGELVQPGEPLVEFEPARS